MGAGHLEANAGTTVPVPCHLFKVLATHLKIKNCRSNLQVSDLQMSFWDLTIRLGTHLMIPAMASLLKTLIELSQNVTAKLSEV